MKTRWLKPLGMGLSCLLLASCAQEREPINQVQANAVDKTFFVGELANDLDNPEFYSKAFVIDQSAGQSGLSVGLYSGTDRIKWEISEEFLIARKSYQIAQNQDHHGVPDGEPNGTVVAKYRIQSHFDIRRAYNPQTGEELNVVVENTTDRPWHERQYMRVDWSTNEVDDPMWGEIFLGKIFGNLEVLPQTYTVTDPKSEDAPHFEVSDGYFDVTNKYYVAPEQTYFAPWGETLPTCALVGIFTGTSTYDCNAQEATVRHSFWKVKADHDFEPTENTKRKMDVIANFGGAGDSLQPGFAGGTTQCWDPQYAYTEECFHQYLAKHNFWAKSHADIACDSNSDDNSDGTADQCTGYAGSKGSQCDLFNKECTLPVRDRKLKSVGYWMNKETPLELLDPVNDAGEPTGPVDASGVPLSRGAMEDVIKSWDQLITVALAYGREAECRRTGDGDRQSCHQQFFEVDESGRDRSQMISFGGWGIPIARKLPGDDASALVSCHAPVRSYDPHETCGETGAVARNGDQRKNWIYYWPHDSDAHYGGVAGLGQDPESGESHGATATVMGRSATRAAANYRDYIQYAIGDTTLTDVVNGLPQQIFNKVMENGYSPDSHAGRAARGEAPLPAATSNQAVSPAPKAPITELAKLLKAQAERTYHPALQGSAQPMFEALASKLRGSIYEAQLVDPGWAMSTVGSDPRSPMSQSTLESASPLRNLDSGRLDTWRADVSSRLADRGVCFMDDVPRIGSINFQGLSRYYLDKFEDMGLDADIKGGGVRDPQLVKQRGEYIYRDLFHGMAKGIAIHEVGHCLGMRHNFASSYDAVNFMPQYWQIRSADGQAAAACNAVRDGSQPDTCMGPRWLDPESDDERGLASRDPNGLSNGRPGVGYFGNSSVMEYEVDYMSPGIGPYDFSYIKAVYGGVLETYDIDRASEGGMSENDQTRFLANLSLQRSELNMVDDRPVHYTDQARQMKLFHGSYCRDATPEELEHGQWRLVHGKVCSQSPRDHAAWQDFRDDDEGGTSVPSGYSSFLNFTAWHTQPPAAQADQRSHVRWNYRYGETYGTGYMHTNPGDTGADVYEVVTNTAKLYDLSYPLTYFRRKNKEFAHHNIPSSIADRYFERARAYHWVLEGSDDFLAQFPQVYDGYKRARSESFYFLARAATAPEPGGIGLIQLADGSQVLDAVDGGRFNQAQIGLIDGRYVSEEYSDAQGGQWDYLAWIDHASFNVERGLALRALVDGRPTLYTISRETFLDGRNVMKNFRTDHALGVDRFLGGILAEDWNTSAMWVSGATPGGEGLPYASPQFPNLLDQAPSRPAGSNPVFPNIGYKTQLATVIFTHLFSRLNSDLTLINKMRVFVNGLDFVGGLPEGEQVRFSDPESGLTYVARRFGDDTVNGKTSDLGIASRMLAHANDILVRAYPVERDSTGVVIDQYGAPKLTSNTASDPALAQELRKYVGLIDATRQVGRMLDGPLNGLETE